MKFEDFMAKYKPNIKKFASSCNITRMACYNYLNKKRIPRQDIAEKIEKETDGLVSVLELRGIDDRYARAKRRYNKCKGSIADVRGENQGSDLPSAIPGQAQGQAGENPLADQEIRPDRLPQE
jgi:hypothetical protein